VTRLLVFIALFFLAVVTVSSVVYAVKDTTAARTVIAKRIAEDDPGWDCQTMGNRICGRNQSYRSRFDLYDELFDCFAEAHYTHPGASWNSQVRRCIPHSD
jgi:hypothetical protein